MDPRTHHAIIRQAARALGFNVPVQRLDPLDDGRFLLHLQGGRTLTYDPAAPADQPADDLTALDGLGHTYAARLAQAGLTTFAQLAAADPQHLTQITRAPRAAVHNWRAAAQKRTQP